MGRLGKAAPLCGHLTARGFRHHSSRKLPCDFAHPLPPSASALIITRDSGMILHSNCWEHLVLRLNFAAGTRDAVRLLLRGVYARTVHSPPKQNPARRL